MFSFLFVGLFSLLTRLIVKLWMKLQEIFFPFFGRRNSHMDFLGLLHSDQVPDIYYFLFLLCLFAQESWLLPTERASVVKTRMNGYHVVKKSWQSVLPFWYITSVWQTDGRTDRIWIAKTCSELLRGWCPWKWMFIFHFSVFIWLEMRINGRYTDRGRECVDRSRPSH